jgi:hypothetical protein
MLDIHLISECHLGFKLLINHLFILVFDCFSDEGHEDSDPTTKCVLLIWNFKVPIHFIDSFLDPASLNGINFKAYSWQSLIITHKRFLELFDNLLRFFLKEKVNCILKRCKFLGITIRNF